MQLGPRCLIIMNTKHIILLYLNIYDSYNILLIIFATKIAAFDVQLRGIYEIKYENKSQIFETRIFIIIYDKDTVHTCKVGLSLLQYL